MMQGNKVQSLSLSSSHLPHSYVELPLQLVSDPAAIAQKEHEVRCLRLSSSNQLLCFLETDEVHPSRHFSRHAGKVISHMKAETSNPSDVCVTDPLAVAAEPNVPRWTFDAQLPSVEAAGSIDDDTCSWDASSFTINVHKAYVAHPKLNMRY